MEKALEQFLSQHELHEDVIDNMKLMKQVSPYYYYQYQYYYKLSCE